MSSYPRRPIWRATLIAIGLFLALLGLLFVAGRALGQEPQAAWRCDDTRFTQLAPRGRSVVGSPVSPPPGCAW